MSTALERLKARMAELDAETKRKPDSVLRISMLEDLSDLMMGLSAELLALWEADQAVAEAYPGQDWMEKQRQREALAALNARAEKVVGGA